MKAYEFNKIPFDKIKIETELIAPVNQKIYLPDVGNILNQVPVENRIINTAKPIKWGRWILGGAITIGIILFLEIPKDPNYQSRFEKRRNGSQGS